MDRLWGEELEENPKDKEIIKELQKYTYDKIIKKPEYDVFYKTDFEKYCKEKILMNSILQESTQERVCFLVQAQQPYENTTLCNN